VSGDFDVANLGAGGGDLAARLDGPADLERLGAFHQGGDELDGHRGGEGGGLDAAGIERPGGRVVLDDGAVTVFGAVEVRVVVVRQGLREGVAVDGADDVGIAQIAADRQQQHLLADGEAMAGAILPGPRSCVGPPVGDEVAGLDATFPGSHGGDGADSDQVVDQALEFSRGRLHGAIVLGNDREGEGRPVYPRWIHWWVCGICCESVELRVVC